MALKVKADDRLLWPLIRETLFEARLPQKMIEDNMNCISFMSFSIVWHGEKTEKFTTSRGVREGDPLCLYLFVLCIKRFNYLIEEFVGKESGNLSWLVNDNYLLPPFFFADD